MSYDATGTIYIPLEEFWEFVRKHAPADADDIRYGVPRVTASGDDLEIDYAACTTEVPPETWSVKPPAIAQWDALKKERP